MSSEQVMKTPPFFINLIKGYVMTSFKYNTQTSFPSLVSIGNGQNSLPVQLKLGKRLLNPPEKSNISNKNSK